jgi:hypothetical protein
MINSISTVIMTIPQSPISLRAHILFVPDIDVAPVEEMEEFTVGT